MSVRRARRCPGETVGSGTRMTNTASSPFHTRVHPPRIPTSLAPLVGRERELSLALELLRRDEVRLLTLTGPGGIGKTRLSLEIARKLELAIPDGVHLVPLASVSHAGLVASMIATALGRPGGERADPRDRLLDNLLDTATLLVLDNMEHVLDAVPFVAELLRAAPGVSILATSRAPLRITGEHVLPVPPLDLPARHDGASVTDLARIPAVRLFVDRARAVDPGFRMTAANAPDIAAICRYLDGIPLAIELAATHITVLPPADLLDRIETGLPLPLPGPRDAPDRLRTMESAIRWSYDLLTPDEQRFFRCAGIFVGGFGLDAIAAVFAGQGTPSGEGTTGQDALPLLASLVSKSLVLRDSRAGEGRFHLLEPIRRFALDRLRGKGEEHEVRDRHVGWYLDLVERTRHAAITPGGERELALLEREHANIRAALEWMFEVGDVDRLQRMVLSLAGFWYEHNHYFEARTWLERMLAHDLQPPEEVRARLQVQLAMFLSLQDEPTRARELQDEGMAVLRDRGDPLTVALALIWQGAVANFLDEYERAEQVLEEALGLAAECGEPPVTAAMTARTLANMGMTAFNRGDLELATVRHEMSLRICREQGYLLGAIRSLRDLGFIAREQGDHARALAYYRECFDLLREDIDQRVLVDILAGAALAAASWDDHARAVRLLAAADSLRRQLGVSLPVSSSPVLHDRLKAATRVMLGERAFDEAWAAGARLTLVEAIAEVEQVSPPGDVAERAPHASEITLSPREHEILRLLVAGRSDREMADLLYLSVRTVEAHVARLRTKLGVRTRTAAVTAAIAGGLVDAGEALGEEDASMSAN